MDKGKYLCDLELGFQINTACCIEVLKNKLLINKHRKAAFGNQQSAGI